MCVCIRLIVSNKKIAKVVIRRPVSTSDEYSSSSSSSSSSSLPSSSSSSFSYSTDGSFGNDINNGSMNENNTQADGKLSPSKFIRCKNFSIILIFKLKKCNNVVYIIFEMY